MTRCTDPQQWAAVPGSDAPEEEVARYLAHVGECAFHAAIEQRETAQLRTMAAFAGNESGSRSLELRGQEATAMRDGLDALRATRRSVFIRALSIRVEGLERARLDLIVESSLTLEVEEGALIGVWHPDQWGEAEDLYLTTYVVRTHSAAPGEKRVSSTVLEGGQRISFAVEPKGDSRAQITVAYAETRRLRALRLSLARLKHTLAYRAREMRWNSALKLAAGLLVLLAAFALLPFLLLRTEESTQIANQAGAPPTVAVPAVVEPAAVPSPSVPRTPNSNAEAPAVAPRNIAPTPRARTQMSLASVRRIYVGMGEGEYHQRLRAAVIAQLQESGRFTVVTREQEADAVLLSELTRGASVRARLLNRAGKPMWFTTQPTSGESIEGVRDVAAGIVRELSEKAAQRSPRDLAPRR